jgi:hypothetical protein
VSLGVAFLGLPVHAYLDEGSVNLDKNDQPNHSVPAVFLGDIARPNFLSMKALSMCSTLMSCHASGVNQMYSCGRETTDGIELFPWTGGACYSSRGTAACHNTMSIVTDQQLQALPTHCAILFRCPLNAKYFKFQALYNK